MSSENHIPGDWSLPELQRVLALPSIAFDGVSLDELDDAVATHPALGNGVCASAALAVRMLASAATSTRTFLIVAPSLRSPSQSASRSKDFSQPNSEHACARGQLAEASAMPRGKARTALLLPSVVTTAARQGCPSSPSASS
jgi:hypothetical protein